MIGVRRKVPGLVHFTKEELIRIYEFVKSAKESAETDERKNKKHGRKKS